MNGTGKIDWEAAARMVESGKDPFAVAGTRQPVAPPFPGASSPIDARTGKPVVEFVPKTEPAPGFLTLLKSGLVDDPKTKIKIFAKARGIDPSRYGILDGEIVFKKDDGTYERETDETGAALLERFMANQVAHSPATILAAAGAAGGGPGGAAMGAAGGEGIRKAIGKYFLGEDQSNFENSKDMIIEGLTALIGERLFGQGPVTAFDKFRRWQRGPLANAAGGDLAAIDNTAMRAAEQQGKTFGVDLFPAQTSGSRVLRDAHTILQDHPVTADIMQAGARKQTDQVETAIGEQIAQTGPDLSPMKTGEEIVGAAKGSVEKIVDIRKNKAKPFYDKAFEETPAVNIEPVIAHIDARLETAKGPVRGAIEKAKSMLMKPDLEEGAEAVMDTTLRGLHDAKMAIDSEIFHAAASGLGNTVKKELQDIKGLLLKQMDEASSDYKTARKIFADYSEELEKQTTKTLTGDLAKLEGDQVEKAAGRLLDPKQSSPDRVLKAKPLIQKQNLEAWDAAIRQRLTDIFEGIKPTVQGERPNLAGRFHQALADKKQQAILKAAMTPEQFQTLMDFSSVLKMAASVNLKESATATRQVILKQMDEAAGPPVLRNVVDAAKDFDLTKPGTWPIAGSALKWLQNNWRKEYKENLAKALVSPEAAAQLSSLRQLSPESEKFWKGFGTFVAMVAGQEVEEKVTKPEDTLTVKVKLKGTGPDTEAKK